MNSIYLKQPGSIKKILFVVVIAAVLVFIAAILFFVLKKSNEEVLSKIPSTAKSVLVVDAGLITKKLVLNEIGKQHISHNALLKAIPDSLSDIDFTKSGLGLLDKIAIFTTEDANNQELYVNFVIKIKDYRMFDDFVKTLALKFRSKVENEAIAHIALNDTFNLILAWDKHFLAGCLSKSDSDKNSELLKNILITDEEHSIMSLPDFKTAQLQSYDLMIYSKPYKICPIKYLSVLNDEIEQITAFVKFKNGEIEIESHLTPKHLGILDKIFTKKNEDFYQFKNEDSSLINLILDINKEAFMQFLGSNTTTLLNKKKIPYLKAWDGRMNLSYLGTKIVNNEYISYDFDDNFNKIEIKRTKQEKIPDIQVIAGLNKIKFDSILKIYKPVCQNNDTLLYAASNYLLKKIDDKLLIYSKQIKIPSLMKKETKENIYLKADYLKLNKILKESNYTTGDSWYSYTELSDVELSVNKSTSINVICKFGFRQKDKNSLFNLLEILTKTTSVN